MNNTIIYWIIAFHEKREMNINYENCYGMEREQWYD